MQIAAQPLQAARASAARRPFAAAAAAAWRPQQRHAWAAPAAAAAAGGRCLSSEVPVAAAWRAAQAGGRGRGRAARLLVRASWGAPVEFTPATVVSNDKVAPQLHRVVIDVGELAAGYEKAGQFAQVKVGDGKPGFFAIASPPDPNNQGLLEFLIKAQGEAAEAIAALGSGAQVSVSPVMGKGFAVDRIPADTTPTVLLFATGSGISPIKALIESGALQADKRPDVRLYFGTRDAEHTAYADRIPAWEASGVKVIQVFSNDSTDGSKYVQEVFRAAPGLDTAPQGGVGVVLCGHKGMCEDVKTITAEAGVEPEKVLLNF